MPLESQETVWAALGVSDAHRVGACQSPGPHVIMNELGSYIHVESNDSSWSNFVVCQGVACRALMIGSPRCSRGWTNGNRQTSTWSIQQDHTHSSFRAYLTWYLPRTRARLVYVDTHPQPHQARPQDGYARHHVEALAGVVSLLIIFAYIYIYILIFIR